MVDEFGTAAGALPPLWSRVVVTPEQRVWFNDQDPNLMVGGPDDSLGRTVLAAQDGVGWVVIGRSAEGLPLVTQDIGPDGQFPANLERRIQVIEEGGDGEGDTIRGMSGIFVAEALGDELPFAADAIAEHLAVLSEVGESFTARVFRAGEENPVTVAETGGVDSWFVDVAFYEEEVWIVTQTSTGTDLWIGSMDGSSVRRVPTPIGRGEDANAFVVDLQTIFGTNGVGAMTLSTATSDDENGVAWVVDVQAARDAAVQGDLPADAEVPAGVYDVLDAQGHVHLLPPPADDPGPLAACATSDDSRINEEPEFPAGRVWLLCWDAMAQLPDGVAHPYVSVERFTGGDAQDIDATRLQSLLESWADGPTPSEADAGISGGLDSSVAMIQAVSIVDDRVIIDLLGGSQVGVLGTSTGRATFVQQLAGMVFQYDGPRTMEIRLDGACENWAAIADVDPGCQVYDESHAPWSQAGDGIAASIAELDDGRHAVYLHEVDIDARTVTFDRIQFLTGKEASAAWDGEGDGPPNDFLILNDRPDTRTATVSSGVDVRLLWLDEDGDPALDEGSWAELPDYFAMFANGDADTPELSAYPFWLTIEGGVITAIEEQYVP